MLYQILKGVIKEEFIKISDKPNIMSFFHGGNLDDINHDYQQPSSKTQYGTGLYLISRYDIAKKYSKGSRKLYIVEVEKGIDISDVDIDLDDINKFLSIYFSKNRKMFIINILNTHKKNESNVVPAQIFNNILVNHELITPKNSKHIRNFLVENGVDYELVNNYFGFGEEMLVLYNTRKIVKIKRIHPKDELETYEIKKNMILKPLVEKIIKEKYGKKDIIEEGWKEIALGASLLLGASFTGNKAIAQKAKEVVNNTEILGKIKSTLENEEGINKLSNFLNMKPNDLNNYMVINKNKVEDNFNTAAKKQNMNLVLDIRDTKTKSGITSRLNQGYAVSEITIYRDTILEPGDVVMIQDTIELNYSNDNMFITASDKLKPEIVRDIQNTLKNINSIGARIISTNIESSTDQEPINIGNEQLAKNRANSVVSLLDSIGVNPPITTKILPNQGPDIYNRKMSSEERQEARKNTAQYRYVKITFIIVLNETVNTPEPLYKVNERVGVKLVKSNLQKKPGATTLKNKDSKETGKRKCYRVKRKGSNKTTNCSFER